ncbi:MAG: HEAT repeat domain-containing protein [Candidatus Wallbacteria bacterium]|nr:HEAT repeat domain-containing protein [Candidatus Wallbacteria bacterium]
MTPVVAPLRRFFPVLALVLSAATFADVLPTPSAVEATARSLAAIERNGVNLDNLTLDEILRDSREAKLAYALREKLRSAGSAAISPLTVVVLQCKRPKTLKLLLDALADLAPKGVADGVLRRLEDPRTDSTLRRQIPRFIGRLGDASHAALLEELANDKDFLLSREAVFALGVLPNKAGVPALYRILDKGPDVCRGAAAETMGEIDEFPAIEKLIEKLMDPDPYVRTFAQTSLTESWSTSASAKGSPR